METLGTSKRDNLRSGDFPIVNDELTLALNQTLARGAALGKVLFAAGDADPDAGNTGDGVITGFALAAGGPPKVGVYDAVCVAAAANAGTFNLYDPDGILVGVVTVAVAFTGGGLTFTIADGAADFIVGDSFTIEVEAGSGQGVRVDNTAVDGTQLLHSILPEAVTVGAVSTVVSTVNKTGQYNAGEITFTNGTTAEYADAARKLSIFFENAVPQ